MRRSVALALTAALALALLVPSAPAHAQLKTTFTQDDIEHLLTRTAFGINQRDLDLIQRRGVHKYLNRILGKEGRRRAPRPPRKWDRRARRHEVDNRKFPERRELVRWWLNIMVETNRPFPEVMALFWHDHFATSQSVLSSDSRRWMFDHVNTLRNQGLGNLRDLLYEVSTDWVMLDWLDGLNSRVGAPNENYAREFWELHTLGADNGYTQADIEEAARSFTGFRKRTNPRRGIAWVEFDESRHDTGDKVIFGITVPGRSGPLAYEEYRDIINLTVENRPVAEFVCKKLFEFFCFADPPQSTIDELADILRTSDYELRPVIRRILLSEEFYSSQAKAGFVRNPVEYSVGFSRATGLKVPTYVLENRLEDAGMRVTMPPGVEGWPKGVLWLSSQSMVYRTNIIREMIYRRDYQQSLRRKLFPFPRLLPPEDQRSAPEVVDYYTGRLRINLDSQQRTDLIDYLNSDVDSNDMVIADPFDGLDEGQIDKKVRGLLYILAAHPTYHMR